MVSTNNKRFSGVESFSGNFSWQDLQGLKCALQLSIIFILTPSFSHILSPSQIGRLGIFTCIYIVWLFEVNVSSPNWESQLAHTESPTCSGIFKWGFVAAGTIEKGDNCDHKCMAAIHFLISVLLWLRAGKQWNIQLVLPVGKSQPIALG